MAKSARSKGERRNKALLYARVFKPVEEARTARLSAKIQDIPALPQYKELIHKTAATSATAAYKSKTQSLFRNDKKNDSNNKNQKKKKLTKREIRTAKVYEEFNTYGLSSKEVRF